MTTIDWKRGDSFVVDESGMLADGVALDMTGWTIASQIRTQRSDTLVANLAVTWLNQDIGAYHLECVDTTAWPIGKLLWDIQFTDPDGYVTSTETVTINCIKDQTRPA